MLEFPSTMEEQIEDMENEELSYRSLHTYATIDDLVNGYKITIPYFSILNQYRHFLEPYVETVPLDHEEYLKYRYSPKSLSFDLYGTTEYWSNILELNNCKSLVDFDLETVRVYNPHTILDAVNEIMILEEILV